MAAKPKVTTIDEYLEAVRDDQRAALEKLRKLIRAAAPKAQECINYGVAAFRLDGKALVGFGASAKHLTFIPMSGRTVADHQDELRDYETSKGAIRFQPDKPLPAALVRKLIKARIAENEGQQVAAAGKPKAGGKTKPGTVQTDPAVTAFLSERDHPLKRDIAAVRRIILGASPEIREGIKWNSVSFRTTEYFATVNWRSIDRVQLVFHKGAKVKDNSTQGVRVSIPAEMVKWLAKERCLVTLGAGREIQKHRAVLETLVREWIGQLGDTGKSAAKSSS